ncbi:MAG: hypothetical protein HQ564_01015 [Candidatus Saganbacteria bacterium]|nr:hypothetical protein [Candidatus Saganbacteria bacterium]
MKIRKEFLLFFCLMLLLLCVFGCGTSLDLQATPSSMEKSGYIQLGATGSLTTISSSAVSSLDIVIFAFGDITTTSIDSSYLTWIETFMGYGSSDAIYLLSIGGEYATPEGITAAGGASAVVSNVVAQVNSYNSSLTNGTISGVDIDLENGVDAATINTLAKGFKDAGFTVSTAPQIFVSSGQAVDTANPTNLVLTSGGSLVTTSTYGLAISNGYVDYIMVQAYNSGWITVNGYYENNVEFIKGIANALNNSKSILSIPDSTKIFIGTVANQRAGGQYNIFNPDLGWPFPVSYDHQAILDQLNVDITAMENDQTNYGNISGIMFWSLNNDYMPTGWGADPNAIKGGFSKTICGAAD